LSSADTRIYLEFEVRRVLCRSCSQVKREHLAFLADNPFYTKRFAFYVGRRCVNGRPLARQGGDWRDRDAQTCRPAAGPAENFKNGRSLSAGDGLSREIFSLYLFSPTE